MPKSILEALYRGEIEHILERKTKHSSMCDEVIDKIENETSYLKSNIPAESWEHFENLERLYDKISEYAQTDIFYRGFTFGALLIFEIMEFKEEII